MILDVIRLKFYLFQRLHPLPFTNSMHMNEPPGSPSRAIERNLSPSSVHNQWSVLTLCSGLGIVFFIIGLTMACNLTVVEAIQNFRESFHRMLGEPSSPYNFAQAAVVFYTVPGAILIALSFRKPTISRTISSLFGALMLSIVLVKALFGSLDTFILFQLLVGIVLLYYGYGASKPTRT